MDKNYKFDLDSDHKSQFGVFYDLMKFRVREILMVSSYYDAFVLEEDGRLSERIFSEYVDLNLRFVPRITRVSGAEEALKRLEDFQYDMVITMTRISDMDALEFGKRVKKAKPGIPVVLLTYEYITPELLILARKTKYINKVFYWLGDSRILLAIIKYVEDLKNAENDIKNGVRAILMIEDSPRFYSIYLPKVYTEIMTQIRALLSDSVNDFHRLLRMRARPKILMAETYEQAKRIYKKYKGSLLGVISDVRFPRKGEVDKKAGFRFAGRVKEEIPDLPILMQSSNLKNKIISAEKGLDFLSKKSENLLNELRHFILDRFGFGDFVFRTEDRKVIAKAGNLSEFLDKLKIIPEESLVYHASRNHISIWLRARTEFEAAEKLRPKKISDFKSIADLRDHIYKSIEDLIKTHQKGVITDFDRTELEMGNYFIKLGAGSLGGKARGIAFLNNLLEKTDLKNNFTQVEIKIPNTYVIGSEVFEEFIEKNKLLEFAINAKENHKIAGKFLSSRLPRIIKKKLEKILSKVKYPLAVRSSSLLEDSQTLPFAGLYSTYMLPNNSNNEKVRLKQLCDAVKLVYASVYYNSPKEYVKNSGFRIEEERMAVIIQQIVGNKHHERFYPVISGILQSYNYYPVSYLEPKDGVSEIALGLGKIIVEGGKTYRFSPKYPEMNPPYSFKDIFKNTQNNFYALDLSDPDITVKPDEDFSLMKSELLDAEKDGTLRFVASTFSPDDNLIMDNITVKGPRIVSFANVLKHRLFPLDKILIEVMNIGRVSFGSNVEVEFAVNIYPDKSKKPQFYLLQIRPMVTGKEEIEMEMEDLSSRKIICRSGNAMGNGIFKDMTDLVYVDPLHFSASKTQKIAYEIGVINNILQREGKKYILIGFGRWGTSDPWLGIPVDWSHISHTRIIVEAILKDFTIDPSRGSHFFHNLTSLKMGYLYIGNKEDEFLLWDWIQAQPVVNQTEHVKHIQLSEGFLVRINGRTSEGIIALNKLD